MTNKTHTLPAPSRKTHLTCQQVITVLVDYVAGDMERGERTAYETHLADCRECLAFLSTYRATIRATRTVRYEALQQQRVETMLHLLRSKIISRPV